MKVSNILNSLFILVLIFSCSKPTNELYSTKSVDVIQVNCEESIKTWIKNYAAFPDSYTPLMFEKVGISSVYNMGKEIVPLRRFTVEHTFIIRNKESNNSHVTLQFELTPDYFVQNIKYKQTGVVSSQWRVFPPKYELWSELYGRTLTESDSLIWKEKNRELLFELSLKLFFNRHVSPEGEDIALSDSLVEQLNRFYHSNSVKSSKMDFRS